jgi:glucokinase
MADGRTALGIDVGGTKIALALVDGGGTVLAEGRIRNQDHPDASALLEAVGRKAYTLVADRPDESTVVGVGICELVDRSGEIVSSTTIPWKREDLTRVLSKIGPVTLEADVRAAARGEATLGAGRAFASFGYITVGTGISSAFVRDGEPWAGSHGAAQLLGSARIDFPCPSCGTVVDICLEDVGSGAAIVRRYRDRTGADATGAAEIIAEARAGDAAAEAVVSDAVVALGSFIALFVNLFDPGAMVMGGGLASSSAFFTRAVEIARDRIWSPPVRSTPILIGELGAAAGAIGAACSAWGAGARA